MICIGAISLFVRLVVLLLMARMQSYLMAAPLKGAMPVKVLVLYRASPVLYVWDIAREAIQHITGNIIGAEVVNVPALWTRIAARLVSGVGG